MIARMSALEESPPRLFSIPPQASFLDVLAEGLLRGRLFGAEDAPALHTWRIYLPTRRAARALAVALLKRLRESADEEGAPAVCLLPRILPLGDVDEEALALRAQAEAQGLAGADEALPEAIAPLPRLFLLAKLMRAWAEDDTQGWPLAAYLKSHAGAALRLARSLARLIDTFENEGVALDALGALLEDDRPQHRLAARELLKFLRAHYPARLREMGLMGQAARRARLIAREAEWLAGDPPDAPVIAAGSTGSLPATAKLLATIARLRKGAVILPGLDKELDAESWAALAPGHPQYGMKQLLEGMGAARADVVELAGHGDGAGQARGAGAADEAGAEGGAGVEEAGGAGMPRAAARLLLLREAMRPVETTDAWQRRLTRADVRDALNDGTEGLHLLMAESRRQEALAIALLMREVLETPGKTCMLITPDRTLARAVRAELLRWNVEVDDSAGRPLVDTPAGSFIALLAEAALNGFEPVSLAALLAHPFACFGSERADCARLAEALQLAVLRPMPRFDGLHALADVARARQREVAENPHHAHPNARALTEGQWRELIRFAERLAEMLQPLAGLFAARQPAALKGLLRALARVAEDCATPPGGGCLLWRGEEGEVLAAAIAEILHHAGDAPDIAPAELAGFLVAELAARPVRARHPAHARLAILGLLEARLLDADRVILGGLNEGVWPEEAQNDPWLNRVDKEKLKLPLPERRIGLSAHDFTQAAAKGEVWLTCARKIEQQPAEPSRWVLRLRAVLRAAGLEELERKDQRPLEWAAALDTPEPAAQVRIAPPRPAPPVHLRPTRFSASRVKTLLREPYAIFAEHVLGLRALEGLSPRPTPALFGTLVHEALEEFARRWPTAALPEDAREQLLALLKRAHGRHIGDARHLALMEGRLKRMAEWVIAHEAQWREGLRRVHVELSGKIVFEAGGAEHRLSARADRIDVLADGTARLMDYKTGVLPSANMLSRDYDPQLDLEAAIVRAGGFAEHLGDVRKVAEMMLVKVSGGAEAGEVREWREKNRADPHERADIALEGLRRLLAAWRQPEAAYLPVDHGERERRAHDFDHLSRWREWLPNLA